MPRLTPIQNSFNAGEWSPQMFGRTDLAKYVAAARKIQNWQIIPQGGLLRRSGSRFIRHIKDEAKKAKMQRFVFSDEQAYSFEFGDFYLRIYRNEGILLHQILTGIRETIDGVVEADVLTEPDEILFVGHGYRDGDGPVQITSDGTIPAGLALATNYFIRLPPTISFISNASDIDITAPDDDEIIVSAGHQFSPQMGPFQLTTTDTLPAGLLHETDYYIVFISTTRFGLSLNPGGGKEDITSLGTGTHTLAPTDAYKRDSFRLGLTTTDIPRDITDTGSADSIHTITPQEPVQPIEVTTPWTEAQAQEIILAQSADVLFIWHKAHPTQKLSRFSGHGFFLEEIDWIDGPYLKENVTATTMAPSAVNGKNITITSTATTFKGSDVGRLIRIKDIAISPDPHWGYAKITSIAPIIFTDGDIESFLFDPADVSTANDTITKIAHGLDTGELVRFKEDASGDLPTPIAEGTDYYVRDVAPFGDTLEFYLSRADALAQANIVVLTVVGTGTGHRITSSVIDIITHGHSGGEGPLQVTSNGILPLGLSPGIDYFVGFVDANSMTLSLSRGGTPNGIDEPLDSGAIHSAHGANLGSTTCTASVRADFAGVTASPAWRLGAWSTDPNLGFPRCGSFHEQRLWMAGNAGAPQTLYATKSADFESMSPTGDIVGTEADDLKLLDDSVDDNNAIVYALGANEVNVILWLSSARTLVLGATSAIWTAQAAVLSEQISPTNLQVKRNVEQGTKAIAPILVADRAMFVSKSGQQIFSLGYSFVDDTYAAEPLSLFAQHLGRTGFVDIDYAAEQYNTVWAVRGDGEIAALTVVREQEISGWARHVIGGAYVDSYQSITDTLDATENTFTDTDHGFKTGQRVRVKVSFVDPADVAVSGGTLPSPLLPNVDYFVRAVSGSDYSFYATKRDAVLNENPLNLSGGTAWWAVGFSDHAIVESVAVIPSPEDDPSETDRPNRSHDQVWLIVKRTVLGVTRRSVEFIEDYFDDDDRLQDAYFVDGGLTYATENGGPTNTVSGLLHQAGETVSVLADGQVHRLVVSVDGVLTLPDAQLAQVIHIGWGYDSDFQSLRMAIPGEGGGTAEAYLGRIDHLTLRLDATLGLQAGEDEFHLIDLLEFLLEADPLMDEVPQLFTGDKTFPIDAEWESYMEIFIRQSDPLPATLLAIAADIQKGGRPSRT
jgi:hypothetical protein